MRRLLAAAALALALLGLGGCASVPWSRPALEDVGPTPTTRVDPWERFNRRMFAFNEVVDEAVLTPVARAYRAVVPEWLRSGVSNMYGNLGDAWSAVNLMLQAKPVAALDMGLRFATNTVFGVFGFLDVADEVGLERRSAEDFGQTLGRWGMSSGPFVVLPLLGPSTVRDSLALTVDMKASPPDLVFRELRDRNAATVLQVIDTRVKLLNASRLLDDIALDKYILLRDAYLARRRSLIYDGNPPDDDEDDATPAAAAASVPAAPAPAASAAPPAAAAAASAPPAAPASAPGQ